MYGFEEEEFFAALFISAWTCSVTCVACGVRGARYAFANSQRLQARLAEMGIRCLHRQDLAEQ